MCCAAAHVDGWVLIQHTSEAVIHNLLLGASAKPILLHVSVSEDNGEKNRTEHSGLSPHSSGSTELLPVVWIVVVLHLIYQLDDPFVRAGVDCASKLVVIVQ